MFCPPCIYPTAGFPSLNTQPFPQPELAASSRIFLDGPRVLSQESAGKSGIALEELVCLTVLFGYILNSTLGGRMGFAPGKTIGVELPKPFGTHRRTHHLPWI